MVAWGSVDVVPYVPSLEAEFENRRRCCWDPNRRLKGAPGMCSDDETKRLYPVTCVSRGVRGGGRRERRSSGQVYL